MLWYFRVPLTWKELLKRTFTETLADDVFNLAAQQAYYFFFALFPAILALISIASFFPVHDLVDQAVEMLRGVAPPDVIDIVVDQMQQISQSRTAGVLTMAFLFTLWSTSTAIVSVCSTLNAAYDIIESRPWWKVRLTAIGLTLGLAVFVLSSVTLVVAGPALAERVATGLGLGAAFEWTWKIAQWPLVFVLVATAVALVYYYAPDAEQEWVWITPGSVLATLLWLAISLALRFYIVNFGNYNETYGAVGGVMVLMLWFYLSGVALLTGAELNAEIEHASPHGKETGERTPGEKKTIGLAAERAYEERRARGDAAPAPFPDGVNCDIDRPAPRPARVRASEILIGAAALLPVAWKAGRDARKRADRSRAA